MKAWRSLTLSVVAALCFFATAIAGDSTCKGYTSNGNHFECGTHGNCVWWASYKRSDLKSKMYHSAVKWYDDAIAAGFSVGSEPAEGAVAVFAATSSNQYGHVAYVESVSSDGSFSVSEMDWFGSFGDGVQNATYSPVSGGYKRGNGASTWVLKGFIYPYCGSHSNTSCSMKRVGNVAWFPAISDCTKASQRYFVSVDANGQYVTIGSATVAACPAYCPAP